MMSDTPAAVKEKPPARSDEDRELAARLVAEANEQGPNLVGLGAVLTRLSKRVLGAGLEDGGYRRVSTHDGSRLGSIGGGDQAVGRSVVRRRVVRWVTLGVTAAVLALQVGCLLPSRPHPPGLYTADEQGRLVVLLSGCSSYSELRFLDRTDLADVEPDETVWLLEREDPEASPTRFVVGEIPDGYRETLRDPQLERRAVSSGLIVQEGSFEVVAGSAQDVDEPGEVYRTDATRLTPEQVADHFDEDC